MKQLAYVAVVFLLLGQAAQANLLIKGAQEIAEAIAKKGGRKAAQELAEFGGEQAIQEVLEKASRQGGEALAGKVIRYGKKYGLSAVKTIDNAPALYVKALDEIPETLVERALWAAQREPVAVTRLLSRHGSDALQVAAKYRGVGTDIVSKLGDDGVRMARNMTENQAIVLARHADDIAALPPGRKSQLVDAILAAPGRVIDHMEKHPRVFLTVAGITTLVALKDDVLGKGEVITVNPDGSRTISKRGLVERMLDRIQALIMAILNRFRNLLSALLVVPAVILACGGVVKIWGCYRRERVRVVLEEKRLEGKSVDAAGGKPKHCPAEAVASDSLQATRR